MKHTLGVLVALAAAVGQIPVQAEDLRYQLPDKVVAQFVDASPNPSASVGPDRRTALLLTPRGFPSIAEIAEPELRLGGIRINPRNYATTRRSYVQALALLDVRAPEPAARPVTGLPQGVRIADVAWSPDGRRVAFTVTGDDAIALWSLDVATASAARVGQVTLVGGFGNPCRWLPDSMALVCRVVRANAEQPPVASTVPEGPVIQENKGEKKPARTNPNLLTNPHDELLFEHYLTSQVVIVGLDGQRRLIGKPGIYTTTDPSPDGSYLLVEAMHRPFSYQLDLSRFPLVSEAWKIDGTRVETVADLPLAENLPVDFDAVRLGRREIEWRGDAAATLCWVEARDAGDPRQAAEVRDEVSCWPAPFAAAPVSLVKLSLRYAGTSWGNAQLALVREEWFKTRKTRTWAVVPDHLASARLLWDRSSEDRYGDPGAPIMRYAPSGRQVLLVTPGGSLVLRGGGASPTGDRPFLDRFEPGSGKSERLWRSEGESFARVAEVLDDGGDQVLLWRESVATPPQLHLATLEHGRQAAERQLTHFPHPVPQLAQVKKQLIHWKRADGVALSGMLYTPSGFRPGVDSPLPVLVWVYPAEFKNAAAASQVHGSPYQFAAPAWGGPMFALTQGYAVIDNPSLPIIGEGAAQPNDTYVAQLISEAGAMIDEVVRLGVGDRERFAIGGHSYGAFTTVNLLAHSNLFRAGIARSGAYNRTLTPFGFQSEERTFWEAPDTYMAMSPFRFAGAITAPLLLIHGAADDNPGTYTIQSDRLFEAMQGLGGQVRYVLLPAEAHGYRARESALHVLWEQVRWLDAKVKNAAPRAKTAASSRRATKS
jgi:dipeptidyl aminopeptidase/acylaminoacyl peptidase